MRREDVVWMPREDWKAAMADIQKYERRIKRLENLIVKLSFSNVETFDEANDRLDAEAVRIARRRRREIKRNG